LGIDLTAIARPLAGIVVGTSTTGVRPNSCTKPSSAPRISHPADLFLFVQPNEKNFSHETFRSLTTIGHFLAVVIFLDRLITRRSTPNPAESKIPS